MAAPAVIVAADKFKGSLTGQQVNAIVAAVVAAAGGKPILMPVADGGDGTLDALAELEFGLFPVTVSGPTGEPVATHYAVQDGVAVVELAAACGLLRLPDGHLQPLVASTRGLGEAARAALQHPGVEELVIGVGGSASTDGGAGMLVGLGAKLRDANGQPVTSAADALTKVSDVDLAPVTKLLAGRKVTLACDVTNPLLGPQGATEVFGPQKGLSGAEAVAVEACLAHWADVLAPRPSRMREAPGAGSAGGTGFAALAALQAKQRSGVELMLELGGFAQALQGAHLVITGEGALDAQSLLGKTVAGVCAASKEVPVIAVCGRCQLSPKQIEQLGLKSVYALSQFEPSPKETMRRAADLLYETTLNALRQWL